MTGKKIYLTLEFLVLFFGVPLFIFFDPQFIHPSAILLPVLPALILYFRFTKGFRFRELVRLHITRNDWIRNIWIILLVILVLALFVLLFDRENFLNLPLGNIWVWLLLCLFYPVFSAYFQEVIYRTFLFRRYRALFIKDSYLLLASGISFSFVHIVYYSPVSIVLTLIAGLYLAWVYLKTGSVLFTAILHGVYGIVVFTIGLGQYFWLDMFEWINKF